MCVSQKKYCPHPHLMVQRYRTHIVSTKTLCFQNFAQNAACLKTLEQCKRFSHPVHPRAAHPSLCSVGVVWVGKQTADTLRYFLAPHQLSFSPRLLLIPMCAPHSGRVLYFFLSFSPQLGNFCDESLRTEVAGVCVRQHQRSALLWFWSNGGSRLRQSGPNADSSLNGPASGSRHVPVTDERFQRSKQQKRAADMSGGEILFQGWLRKSPPEKKLRRYVSIWDFCWVLFFLFWLIDGKESGFPLCPCFAGHVRL